MIGKMYVNLKEDSNLGPDVIFNMCLHVISTQFQDNFS